jgi:aquaporin Z
MTRDADPQALTPALPGLGDALVGEHGVAVPGEPEYGLFAKLGAEVFGTFALVLATVGVALYAGVGGVGAGALGIALAAGITVIAGSVVAGHISGGHFNPAVTLGAAVAGRTPWSSLLPYWLAQVVGGALATALLFIVTANFPALAGDERVFFAQASNGFREHSPIAAQAGGVGFGLLGAFVVEVAVTAVFVTVFLGARSRRAPAGLAPFTIGLTYAAMLLVAIPVTNGSLNPARSTASALLAEPWALEQLWVFWVAPLIGAGVAGAVAFVIFEPRMTVLELDDEDVELDDEPADAAASEADSGGTSEGPETARS